MMHVYLEPYFRKFIKFNSDYWCSAFESKSDRYFLVEGLLATMPTHLIRIGIAAKAMERQLDRKPVVIVAEHDSREEKLFASFGIKNFVYLSDFNESVWRDLAAVSSLFRLNINHTVNGLLSMTYNGINIGNLIYDDYLHENYDCYTIEKLTDDQINSAKNALIYLLKYKSIIKEYRSEYILVSHDVYIRFGMLVAAGIQLNQRIVMVNDAETAIYDSEKNMKIHNRISERIDRVLRVENEMSVRDRGEKYLRERISGETGLLIDAKNAYKNKKVYTREIVKSEFTHNDKKNVFVFMHVFSDSPHCADMTIYKDYYDWIVDTVNVASNIKNVNWFFKVHPSAYVFGETERAKDIILEKNCNNFHIVPDNFSALCVKECADAIITCNGTIGIEASCFGIPVIVVGKPFYMKKDICISPRSREEYHDIMFSIDTIQPLSKKKISYAYEIIGAYEEQMFIDNSILNDDVYRYGGYGKNTDMLRVMNSIENSMKKYNYTDIPLYKRVSNMLK